MEISESSWHLSVQIDFLCKKINSKVYNLSLYQNKQEWTNKDSKEVLNQLKNVFLSNRLPNFGDLFSTLLLDIVWRSRLQVEKSDHTFQEHQDFCIALSHCLKWPDIQRFTLDYINNKPGFIIEDSTEVSEPKKKKIKRSQTHEIRILNAAWLFSYYLGTDCSHIIPIKHILPYTNHESIDVRWFACLTIMELQRLSPTSREEFLSKHFTVQEIIDLKIRHKLMDADDDLIEELKQHDVTTNKKHIITEKHLCDQVVCIGGILISKINNNKSVEEHTDMTLELLPVPSNKSNLHSLALGVSSGSPVLLQGIVGAGKTSLVEHLAKLTGRLGPPELMKIQMGDQMDSKALLGTYRCTEVPGEFVWQPGVLTQAVTQGYWVLLEDIDYAPMDVISILLPLLETRSLSVPGHGDTIRAAPGFQLFATQRLLSTSTGWSKQHSSNCILLDKLWTSVLVEPLSRQELSLVLCSKYPDLSSVVDKLLDIYFLLSAGGHQTSSTVTMEMDKQSAVGKFLTHDGRQISTRDLMTWCSRIYKDFDVTSSAVANMVFLEALDCFIACITKQDKRLPVAEAIAANLNITKVKVEYFMTIYKPDITLSTKTFTVGRVTLPIVHKTTYLQSRKPSLFSYTRQSSVLLERVSVCVQNKEPVLLVGETGTGKTSAVQYLAEQLGIY
ncbi:AAA ATPase midasin [Mactra antiquata]